MLARECDCVFAGLREWAGAHTNRPQSVTRLPPSRDDIVVQRITLTMLEIELVLWSGLP